MSTIGNMKPRQFVKEFQKRAGLLIDGVAGPQTRMALWLIPEPPMGGRWYPPAEDPVKPCRCNEPSDVMANPDTTPTPIDLDPGDYLMTSTGDGTGRAIVTEERRLLVEQFGGGWSDLTHIYPGASWKFAKADPVTPTPIDPADIRPGDVVRGRREVEVTVQRVEPGVIIDQDGDGWRPSVWDFCLVHRPDPDAEAVEALEDRVTAAVNDWRKLEGAEWRLPNFHAERIVAHVMASIAPAALREQGWDVVRRAES